MKRTYTQKTEDYSHYPTVLPVSQGGTGESNLTDIVLKYKLIPLDAIGVTVAKKPTGQLSIEDFSSAPSGFDVTLSGPKETSAGVTETYTITNYDFSMNYGEITNIDPTDLTIQANPSVNGEVVTYKAPGKEGNYGFKLNGRSYTVLVSGAKAVQPIILQPAMNGVVGQKVVDFIGTSFSVAGGGDTLELATWELSTETVAAGGSPTFPQTSTTQSTSTTTTFTCNTLQVSKTYYLRVKYKGKTSKESDWSTVVTFTTAANFSKLSVKKKITNPNLNLGSNFGQCVRLFDHGTKIAIGAPGYNASGAAKSGAVFIYDTITGVLINTITESPAPVANNRFGESLDINEAGDVIVIGIPGWSSTRLGVPVTGKYQIFQLSGNVYTIYKYVNVYADITPLTPVNGNGNGNGTTGGGFKCNIEEGVNLGALGTMETYIEMNWPGKTVSFSGGVTVWLRLTRLYNSGLSLGALIARDSSSLVEASISTTLSDHNVTTNDSKFGHKSISIFVNNGDVHRFIGCLKSDPASATRHYQSSALVQHVAGCGFVNIAAWNGSDYNTVSNLVAPQPDCVAGDDFSWDMAVALRGRVLVVSAPGVDSHKGKVYVFEQRSYTYEHVLVAVLKSDDPIANERFGVSVSINDLGTEIVVGAAPYTSGTLNNCGKTYKFSLTGNININGGWELVGSFISPTAIAGDMLGYSVSQSRGGDISAVSAPNEDSPQNVADVGAVYLLV